MGCVPVASGIDVVPHGAEGERYIGLTTTKILDYFQGALTNFLHYPVEEFSSFQADEVFGLPAPLIASLDPFGISAHGLKGADYFFFS